MDRTNQNEQNSSIKQALLDLEKVSAVSPDAEATKVLKAVKTLLRAIDKQPKLLREADKIFNQHRYNDKKVHFTKMQNFKKNQIIFSLTDRECKILLYMLGFMSQQNMVAIKQAELAKELRTAKRDINVSLKELEKKGCITKVFTDKKSGVGTIYMVNPEIASVGKHDNHGLFQKITPPEQLNEFLLKTNKLSADVINLNTTHILPDGTSITVKANFKITKDE